MFGGKLEKTGEDYLIRNGEKRCINLKCVTELFPNAVIIIQTPGKVEEEILGEETLGWWQGKSQGELVSAERAEREYGVV